MPMSRSKREARIRRRRRQLAKDLGAKGEFLRGSLVERYTVCGRPGCRCVRGRKHGPYLYVSVFDGKRSRQVYVPQSMQTEVRVWARNYREFAERAAEISQLSVELIRLRHGRKGQKVKGE